jgi:hypothetical protein
VKGKEKNENNSYFLIVKNFWRESSLPVALLQICNLRRTRLGLEMEMEQLLEELGSEPWGTLVVPSASSSLKPTSLEGGTPSSSSYFIKSKFSSTRYTFLVTDLVSVWIQSCERADIKRLKQVPPLPSLSSLPSLWADPFL